MLYLGSICNNKLSLAILFIEYSISVSCLFFLDYEFLFIQQCLFLYSFYYKCNFKHITKCKHHNPNSNQHLKPGIVASDITSILSNIAMLKEYFPFSMYKMLEAEMQYI